MHTHIFSEPLERAPRMVSGSANAVYVGRRTIT